MLLFSRKPPESLLEIYNLLLVIIFITWQGSRIHYIFGKDFSWTPISSANMIGYYMRSSREQPGLQIRSRSAFILHCL